MDLQSGYVSGHTDGFLTLWFSQVAFSAIKGLGRYLQMQIRLWYCYFKKEIIKEEGGCCCDCWHLWPPFICVRGGLASLWLRLPWRGSGGGLPGLQPQSQSAPECDCDVQGQGAQVCRHAQIMGDGWPAMAGNVTVHIPLGVTDMFVQVPVGSLWSEGIVVLYVFPPFGVISYTGCGLVKEFKQLNQMYTLITIRNWLISGHVCI